MTLHFWADDAVDIQLRYDDDGGYELPGGFLSGLFYVGTIFDAPGFKLTGFCNDMCEPETGRSLEYVFTDADIAKAKQFRMYLLFSVFQAGLGTTNATNPFGLLYSGIIEHPITIDIK